MIKVLVADDHAVVRRGLRQILTEEADMLVGGEASTAQGVRDLVRDQRWDVIVLDINMPGGNGLELLSELRRDRPDVRVLVLTVYPEEQYAVRAIKAGAAGFLTKESAPEKLIEAVRKIAAGGRHVSPELAETLASLVAGEADGAPHERLSDREYRVMWLLASGKTLHQIAEEMRLSPSTVSTYRGRILKKLGLNTNVDLVHYAMKHRLIE